ncbi:MAG: glycine zipper family protein [Gammaproteobacteria bacterium]
MKRISALGVVLCGLALTAATEAASPAYCSDYAQREAQYAAPTGSGLVRGGVRGAAGGALFGAIAGDAGTGAAIGSIVGGVAGGARNQGLRAGCIMTRTITACKVATKDTCDTGMRSPPLRRRCVTPHAGTLCGPPSG